VSTPYDLVEEALRTDCLWIKASRAFVDYLDGESEPVTVTVEPDVAGTGSRTPGYPPILRMIAIALS